MTTAHKPTWHAAKGGSNQGGNVLVTPTRQYSSKDMPAHLNLKTREQEQSIAPEAAKPEAYKRDLIEREQKYLEKKENNGSQAITDSAFNNF